MLDLECTSVEAPNPAIIELAAVHFDSDTGAELGSLKTPINLKSCLDKGLVTDEGAEGDCTWNWLHHNIPETLIRSQETSVSLEQALFKLSQFVRKSCATWEERQQSLGNPVRKSVQPIIWGNGAVADNIWIRSAYQACGMERPWRFTSDICVRTAMHLVQSMSGRNFKYGEQFEGNAHDALDDCRHQIKYLVKAVNYIKEGERLRRSAKSLEVFNNSFQSIDCVRSRFQPSHLILSQLSRTFSLLAKMSRKVGLPKDARNESLQVMLNFTSSTLDFIALR